VVHPEAIRQFMFSKKLGVPIQWALAIMNDTHRWCRVVKIAISGEHEADDALN
jgi:hypothetical protein